jgi:hypothetical protein
MKYHAPATKEDSMAGSMVAEELYHDRIGDLLRSGDRNPLR